MSKPLCLLTSAEIEEQWPRLKGKDGIQLLIDASVEEADENAIYIRDRFSCKVRSSVSVDDIPRDLFR